MRRRVSPISIALHFDIRSAPLRVGYNVDMPSSAGSNGPSDAVMTERDLFRSLGRNIGGIAAMTSTTRAARALGLRYRNWKSSSGGTAWATPQILPWDAWLESLWQSAIARGLETRVLLTETQEQELWKQVLKTDPAAQQVLSTDLLAEMVQGAWQSMHQYEIPMGRLRGEPGIDAGAFYRWATKFSEICRKGSLLSPALLEAAASEWIASVETALPEEMFLLGFDRMPPSRRRVIERIEARDCRIRPLELGSPQNPVSSPTIVCAHTFEEEANAAARWAREALLQDRSRRIGIVVPALAEKRTTLDSIFRGVLAPSSVDIRAGQTPLPYEFSLGTPMDGLAPIRTALLLLCWPHQGLSQEELSWLLVHGGFGGEKDSFDARATLDRRFRESNLRLGGPVSLPSFREWLAQHGQSERSSTARGSVNRLSIAAERLSLSKTRSYADWTEAVEELLDAAEWRLLAPSESREYQLLRRWGDLLNEFSSLNSVSEPVRFSTALETLNRQASAMLFTLESHNAPIQILGVSESAGLTFDSIWWMSAQVGTWPPQGAAQPFLPWPLQRQAHMPYADPVEDRAFALRVTNRILNSATTAVVSFDLQQSDSEFASGHTPPPEIVLSPTVREALPQSPIVAVKDFQPGSAAGEENRQTPPFEAVEEEPPVPLEASRVSGGVRFLELQAACPFRAFSELRLGAHPLEEAALGLSPAVQGTVFHRVLERFWKQAKSRNGLLESTEETIRNEVRGHIQDALQDLVSANDEPWQQALLAIEAERIEQRVLEWLEEEKQRPDFTVLTTEAELTDAHLGELEFRCRVDRLDQVEQGVVLLDYKTGAVTRIACEGDRPDLPQLPAYAVLREQLDRNPLDGGNGPPVAGVAFASLRSGNVGFVPVRALAGVFPQNEPKRNGASFVSTSNEIQGTIASWSTILHGLARDFRVGAATVDPKNPAVTCKHCPQTLLCRIHETAVELEDEPEDDEEGDGHSDR